MTLNDLILRCEEADGADRELDAAIMFDLYAKPVGAHEADGGPTGYLWPEDNASWTFGHRFPGKNREWFAKVRNRRDIPRECPDCGSPFYRETLLIERDGALVLMNELRIPRLTASLDAAMSLVPTTVNGRNTFPLLHKIKADEWRAHIGIPGPVEQGTNGKGKTPALALTAASLRAIAANKEEG
jgi:hypothetical protein